MGLFMVQGRDHWADVTYIVTYFDTREEANQYAQACVAVTALMNDALMRCQEAIFQWYDSNPQPSSLDPSFRAWKLACDLFVSDLYARHDIPSMELALGLGVNIAHSLVYEVVEIPTDNGFVSFQDGAAIN